MRTGLISRIKNTRHIPSIATEAELLELFAPILPENIGHPASYRSDHARLWRADAIHRAKNMAQLATSLAHLSEHPSQRWLSIEATAQARRLSRAYEALSVDGDQHGLVPCAALLTEVVTRLTAIFGRVRNVAITVSAQPIVLPPEIRRALVLMCSELVINALKYGYPTDVGGTISVSLSVEGNALSMIVEDDGVGVVESYAAGNGGGLIDRLCAVLGATLIRSTGHAGRGFRVSAVMPVDHPRQDRVY